MDAPGLPTLSAQPDLLRLFESVGKDWLATPAGMEELFKLLEPVRGACDRLDKLSVLAVLLVEASHPPSQGLFLPPEEMERLWHQEADEVTAMPKERFALLVASCVQITSMGDLREGAQRVGQTLDRIVPED